MSAFLAGIASGAGDVYAQAAEEKRQQKIAQQKSVSDALLHQLQNDDTQTNPEKYATLGQYLRNTGVKEPDIQKILEASTYHHRMREEQSANNSGQITNPGTPLPGSPDVAAKTVTPPAVHLPNGQVDAGTGPQGTPSQLPATAGQENGLPPLPQYQAPAPKTYADYKADAAGKLDIAKYSALNEYETRRLIAVGQYNRAANLQLMKDLKGEGGHYKPTMNSTGGMTLTPDMGTAMHGLYYGKDIPTATDVNGVALDPTKLHTVVRYADGATIGYPAPGNIKGTVEPDQNSPTKLSRVYRDEGGNEVERVTGAAYDPRLGDIIRNHDQLTDLVVGGHIVKATIPLSSSSQHVVPGVNDGTPNPSQATPASPIPSAPVSQVVAPGQSASPAAPVTRQAPPPPSPAGHVPSMPVRPRGTRILGTSPAEQKMLDQNQLTPTAQKDVRDTQVTLDLVDRVEQQIKQGIANGSISKDAPLTEFLPSLAYTLGYAGPDGQAQLLSQLNMGRIIEAGRLTHPTGSRAVNLLDRAMVHTPNAWKDSGALMVDKLESIKKQLNDYINESYQYNGKFPGIPGNQPQRPGGPSGPSTPLPTPETGAAGKKSLQEIFSGKK